MYMYAFSLPLHVGAPNICTYVYDTRMCMYIIVHVLHVVVAVNSQDSMRLA